MPANPVTVNLFEHDTLAETPIGRIISWATTSGRYIMILTEIVVLLAFASRFSLDRKLTDLNEAIDQKKAIIEANMPFEKEVRNLQARLEKAKELLELQAKPVDMLLVLKTLLPPDIRLITLQTSNRQLMFKAIAGTTDGFSIFLNNLQQIPQFQKVEINEVKKESDIGIAFRVTITLDSKTQNKATTVSEKDQL